MTHIQLIHVAPTNAFFEQAVWNHEEIPIQRNKKLYSKSFKADSASYLQLVMDEKATARTDLTNISMVANL